MDMKVCPYCNRSYTVTLSNGKGKSRPQFDHFKSKMKYPYFALSLLNLIPCCGLCNQAKLERENNILYPYFDEMGTDILFRNQIENGIRYLTGAEQTEDEFSVVLEAVNDVDTDIVIRSVQSDQVFHLTELYNEHKDYILKMFSKRYIFNDSYLKMLYQILCRISDTVVDGVSLPKNTIQEVLCSQNKLAIQHLFVWMTKQLVQPPMGPSARPTRRRGPSVL